MKQEKHKTNHNNGFTLVELLIVIAVLAILAGIVMVALNPKARFEDSRNTRRVSDIDAIISALKIFQIDNAGNYIANLEDATADMYYQIGLGSNCNDTCVSGNIVLQTDCLDIEELTDVGYLPSVPIDPGDQAATEDETRYYIVKKSTGAVEVGACSPELGSNSSILPISISR